MARRPTAATSSTRSKSAAGRAGGARSDGRVDAPCPQCGTRYRVTKEALEQKIECQECHRVFFPKTTAGKRAQGQDYTKAYVGFGIGAVVLIGLFMMFSSSDKPAAPPPPKQTVEVPRFSLSKNPRVDQLVAWANAVAAKNLILVQSHLDVGRAKDALKLDAATDTDGVIRALLDDPTTRYLRDLKCEGGTLPDEAAMTASSATGTVSLLPAPDNKDYEYDRAEIELAFHMDGDQVKIEGWKVTRPIRRKTADPDRKGFALNKDIQAGKTVEITDSAGTRKVMESEPGPVPHWQGADEALRKKVDAVIAGVIQSAEEGGPPLARFTLQIREKNERLAAVPRALNAMYELYTDAAANKMKLSQLNQALVQWTGFAVNFQVADSKDAAKDKKERESCVRQWFAFWWRYSSHPEEFFNEGDDLLTPDAKDKPKDDKAKK